MFNIRRPKAVRRDTSTSDERSSDGSFIEENLATNEVQGSPNLSSSDIKSIDGGTELDDDDDGRSNSGSRSPPDDGLASISFGALARAQASLSGETLNGKKRKRPSVTDTRNKNPNFDHALPSPPHPPPPPHSKANGTDINDHAAEALERKAGKKDDRKLARASKHAPAELSSKKAVSRKRSVVTPQLLSESSGGAGGALRPRDPRFESALGPVNAQKVKHDYAFLDVYRESEIASLRAAVKDDKKKTKSKKKRMTTSSPEEQAELQRELLRMESRRKAQERKDAEQAVRSQHRKEERARVEAGKRPFYLKRAEVRKAALVERYKGMKGKEVERLVERRRKKLAASEKRSLPRQRRVG